MGVAASLSIQTRSALGSPITIGSGSPFLTPVRIAHRRVAQQRADGVVDIALLDPEKFQLVLIDGDAQARTRMTIAVADVHNIRDGGEHCLAGFGGHCPPGCGIGAIEFGQQRGQHRRPRRYFHHFQHTALR